MTIRLILIVFGMLINSHSKADLLLPNPFVKKTSFYPEIISIANKVSARPTTGSFPQVVSISKTNWKLDYGAFKLTIDCTSGRTVAFEYSIIPRTDNEVRIFTPSGTYREPMLDGKCYQLPALPLSIKYKRAYLFNPKLIGENNSEFPNLVSTVTNTIPLKKSNSSWEEVEKIIRNNQLNGPVNVKGKIFWRMTSHERKGGELEPPERIAIEIAYSAISSDKKGKITLNLSL